MTELLRDSRVVRLVVANTLGSIGSGITIFAVPWLLIHKPEGSLAFRWTTMATTVVLFCVLGVYGAWLDRHSRKTMLLGSEAFGFLATSTMALSGLAFGGFATWQLVTVYFCGMLYYTLHYPAKFAMIQQMFEPSQYQSLMGLLEVQGQTAMMIAGGLGGVLVEHWPLGWILTLDASTYLLSFVLLASLPYRATHLETAETGAAPVKTGLFSSVIDGGRWLWAHPQLNLFLTCTLVPFIVVMASNYLFPIYVSQTLATGAWAFAGGEIVFALGAIAAGLLVPRWVRERSAVWSIGVTMVVFMVGLLVVIALPKVVFYFAAGAFLGFGNAGVRVARSGLMLHKVPNGVMGRVGAFYNVIDRVLRTIFVFALGVIDIYGPPSGFMVLAAIVALAFAGYWVSRSAVQAEPEVQT